MTTANQNLSVELQATGFALLSCRRVLYCDASIEFRAQVVMKAASRASGKQPLMTPSAPPTKYVLSASLFYLAFLFRSQNPGWVRKEVWRIFGLRPNHSRRARDERASLDSEMVLSKV